MNISLGCSLELQKDVRELEGTTSDSILFNNISPVPFYVSLLTMIHAVGSLENLHEGRTVWVCIPHSHWASVWIPESSLYRLLARPAYIRGPADGGVSDIRVNYRLTGRI